MAVSQHVFACNDEPIITAPDRSWVQSDVTIYGVLQTGQLFKTSFNSNKVLILTDHHFNGDLDVHVSQDKRYVLYNGSQRDTKSPYYLYDIKLQKESVLPEPKIGDFFPTFSPESDMILLENLYRGKNELYLFDIATSNLEPVPYPDSIDVNAPHYINGKWSQDGQNLYIETGITDAGYYDYKISTHSYTMIDGRYIDGRGTEFIENGQVIETYDDGCTMQSNCSYPNLKSPSGKMTAKLGANHALVIDTGNSEKELVVNGSYSQCFGESIRLYSWLGNDQYLIYELDGIPYIYGVTEKRKSVLFDPRVVEDYFWVTDNTVFNK